MKTLSSFLLMALLFTACGTTTPTDEETMTEEMDTTPAVEETASETDAMMADFQDARDMWAEVVAEGAEADMQMAILQMKAVYAKIYYYVHNGTAPESVVTLADDLNGLIDNAEAGEFEMAFFVSALEEGLTEYDSVLAGL